MALAKHDQTEFNPIGASKMLLQATVWSQHCECVLDKHWVECYSGELEEFEFNKMDHRPNTHDLTNDEPPTCCNCVSEDEEVPRECAEDSRDNVVQFVFCHNDRYLGLFN
jgi:hypothetical protein